MKRFLMLLFVLAIVGTSWAGNYVAWFNHFDVGVGNDNWSEPGNWHNGNQMPQPGGDNFNVILYPQLGSMAGKCVVNMDVTADINNISIASSYDTELEIISGGKLVLNDNQVWPIFGDLSGRTDILTLNGGVFDTTTSKRNRWLAFGDTNGNGDGILNMNAGILYADHLRIDWGAGGENTGTVNMNGGTIVLNGILRMDPNGIVNLNGGRIVSKYRNDVATLQGYITAGTVTGDDPNVIYVGGDTVLAPQDVLDGIYTWQGDVSTDWTDELNWAQGLAPISNGLALVFVDSNDPNWPVLFDDIAIGTLTIGSQPNATAQMALEVSATVSVSETTLGKEINSEGTLWVSGGSYFGSTTLNVGVDGVGQLNVNDGIVHTSTLNVASGSNININRGQLLINGDATASVATLEAAGEITAYGGYAELVVDYDITRAGITTVTAEVVDYDRDGTTDFADFARFASHWLETTP